MSAAGALAVQAAEPLLRRDLLPDALIRLGIRRLIAARHRAESTPDETARMERLAELAEAMREAPVAPATAAANGQHYEVPTRFFELVLGPRLKYSSALWPAGVSTLGAAEEAMLELTVRRAGIADGQTVLDLGCGWGSLSFYVLERFPNVEVDAVTSSATQREHLVLEAARRGVGDRLRVHRCDVADLRLHRAFDRIVSIEMFEHLRNWAQVLHRLRDWLEPGGELFLHVFCHRRFGYPFEERDASDWMARRFFTGGLMPSLDLVRFFADDFSLETSWWVPGTHYARTAAAWLANADAHRRDVEAALGQGDRAAARAELTAWRVFFMACEELFAYRGGDEWGVAHWRLRPQPEDAIAARRSA